MDPDPPRHVWALFGTSGALVWGTLHLVAMWRAGTVSARDLIGAGINVFAAFAVGAGVSYFLGPALTPMVPIAGLRDAHVIGFGLGFFAFELVPVVLDFAHRKAKKISREKL